MLQTLWIMRHGLAESEFDSDFNRALSAIGRREAESVANQMMLSQNLPTEMLVSPFRRTQETAQVVHKILAIDKPFETEEMLVHFADHRVLGDYLLSSDKSSLIIVSHMPIVAKLCQYLCPSSNIFGFQTAQVVRLEFEQDLNSQAVQNVKLAEVFLPGHG